MICCAGARAQADPFVIYDMGNTWYVARRSEATVAEARAIWLVGQYLNNGTVSLLIHFNEGLTLDPNPTAGMMEYLLPNRQFAQSSRFVIIGCRAGKCGLRRNSAQRVIGLLPSLSHLVSRYAPLKTVLAPLDLGHIETPETSRWTRNQKGSMSLVLGKEVLHALGRLPGESLLDVVASGDVKGQRILDVSLPDPIELTVSPQQATRYKRYLKKLPLSSIWNSLSPELKDFYSRSILQYAKAGSISRRVESLFFGLPGSIAPNGLPKFRP